MESESSTQYLCVLQSNGKDYKFTTNHLVTYDAYFTEGDGYFPGTSFAEKAIMFNLIPEEGSPPPRRLDTGVMATAIDIIAGRFLHDRDTVICYVCDPKDGRPHKRAARFNRAFDQGNTQKDLIKIDIPGPPLFGAVLYHRDNPAGPEIEQATTDLLSKF